MCTEDVQGLDDLLAIDIPELEDLVVASRDDLVLKVVEGASKKMISPLPIRCQRARD